MASEPALSQNTIDDWWGTLEVAPDARPRLAVHLVNGPDGRLAGTLDSLDQQVIGLPLVDVARSGDRFAFRLEKPAASFDGRWDDAAKSWRGTWRQNGQSWPLLLAPGKPPVGQAAAPQEPINWTLPSNAEVAQLLDARVAQRRGGGIVAILLDPADGRRVSHGPSTGAPFDGRTVFEIGSMSKIFTALILADMASKGEVSLDDPAENYLPAAAKMPERNGCRITLRDLATHSSALPRLPDNMPFGNPQNPYADYDENLLLDFLGRYRLTRDIGSQFEYSNLGYGLLGYLLGRAARSDYATLLARRITGPLKMRDTVIALSPDQQARFAQGHDQHMQPAAPWTLPILAGAGAIRSTADDMQLFSRAALDPNSPIGPAMKLAVSERRPMGDSAQGEIGLGWIVSKPAGGHEILFHNGGTGGFRSAMVLDPGKGRGVVVLTNAAVEPATDDLAMHLLLGMPVQPAGPVPAPPPASNARTEVRLPSHELDRVVGRYQFAPAVELTVEREGAGLKARLTGQPAFPIFPEAPLRFFWRVVDAEARFAAGDDGKVTGVMLVQDGNVQNAKRIAP